jgi:hypothetical protein
VCAREGEGTVPEFSWGGGDFVARGALKNGFSQIYHGPHVAWIR